MLHAEPPALSPQRAEEIALALFTSTSAVAAAGRDARAIRGDLPGHALSWRRGNHANGAIMGRSQGVDSTPHTHGEMA